MATHIPPLSQNVSCTATLQREHVCQIWFEMHFPLNFWHNMPLPWQHTFLHCQRVCFAQLHHTATMCAKVHFKGRGSHLQAQNLRLHKYNGIQKVIPCCNSPEKMLSMAMYSVMRDIPDARNVPMERGWVALYLYATCKFSNKLTLEQWASEYGLPFFWYAL